MNHQYRIFHKFVGLGTPLSVSRNKLEIKNIKITIEDLDPVRRPKSEKNMISDTFFEFILSIYCLVWKPEKQKKGQFDSSSSTKKEFEWA